LDDGSWGFLSRLWFLTSIIEELQVILTVENHKVIFLLDSRACFTVIPFSPGPRSNNKVSVWGTWGQALERYFTQPLEYSWGNLHFYHLFLIVPKPPFPLLGRDFLSILKVQILLSLESLSACP
jgi:hypothetical protein